ncbi:MAG: hypothetical protein ACM32O_00465 [Clostridia bacterium]
MDSTLRSDLRGIAKAAHAAKLVQGGDSVPRKSLLRSVGFR